MINGYYYYYSRFGISGVFSAVKNKLSSSSHLLKVDKEKTKFPFYLRLQTSDVPTFDKIFIEEEYDFETTSSPKTIIDAGANIGLVSIYFANKYPKAKIIAIEPEKSNFALLKRNTSPYSNVIPVQAALWHKNEEINLVDPGLGKWGFMTEAESTSEDPHGNACHRVQAITVDKIMSDYNLDTVDIFKVDVEGAEKEVFSDTSAWLSKVDSIIIELHERMKTGCNRSFYNGSNGFVHEWTLGENVYLSKGNCIARAVT